MPAARDWCERVMVVNIDASPLSDPSSLPAAADAVVIGAGVNGLSTAFQLVKRGLRDVVVLERGVLAAGATGKSGALVRCHYANLPESLLTLHSVRIFENWNEAIGSGNSGFDPVGFLRITTPEHETSLRANVSGQQAAGINTRLVTRDEAIELEPFLTGSEDFSIAAFEENAGYADPNATAAGFAAAAARLGAKIFTNLAATRVRTEGGVVTGVDTAAGHISTNRVLIAAGSWANALLLPLGLDFGLHPVRSQVVIYRRPPRYDARPKHMVVIDDATHGWFRPVGDFATLAGAERSVSGIDPDQLDEGVPAESVAIAREALGFRFPPLAKSLMRGGWAGTYMRSPDGHPIIDRAPGYDGLWLMAGDSGTSFKTSPAIGVCLAEWMTDGAPALMDLKPFRATRFAEGQPWYDEYSYGDDRQLTVSR